MPSPALDIAVGIDVIDSTFSNATAFVSMPITDVKLPGAEIEVHNSSHQGTRVGTNAHAAQTFISADLYDCGTFECTVQHKQDADVYADVGKTQEGTTPIRINLPYVTSGTNASFISFFGVMQSYQPQATTLNEPIFADVVVKIDGDVTPTTAA